MTSLKNVNGMWNFYCPPIDILIQGIFGFDKNTQVGATLTSNSLSVTDTTPPRKQVRTNNMVRNCIFAIVTAVQVQADTWRQ